MTDKRYMIVHSEMPLDKNPGEWSSRVKPEATDRLEALVSSYMEKGWVCQGGPFYMERDTDDEKLWGQAMVRGLFLHRLLSELKKNR